MPPRASPAPAPDTRTPSTVTKRQSPSSIVPPTISSTYTDFEYSVHICPRPVLRDIPIIFPDLRSRPTATVLLIPTLQRASVDLVTYGDEQAVEKDRLLARFVDWASKVRSAVARLQPDAWTDITDPASGVAHFGTAGACYSDVEGIVKTRNLSTIDCGGCRVAKHPDWGFAMYPGTYAGGPVPTFTKLTNRSQGRQLTSPLLSYVHWRR